MTPPLAQLIWSGPDEDGDYVVSLVGIGAWHLSAHGPTPKIALIRLGEQMAMVEEDNAPRPISSEPMRIRDYAIAGALGMLGGALLRILWP